MIVKLMRRVPPVYRIQAKDTDIDNGCSRIEPEVSKWQIMMMIRVVWILSMLKKGASFFISFIIAYTGASFIKGKEIIPSHNAL